MSDDIVDRLMGTGGAATHSTLDRVDAADEIIGLRGACARLRAENARLREALAFYADKTNYHAVVNSDGDIKEGMDYRDGDGNRARAAMGESDE